MKIKAKITILISGDATRIEVRDSEANTLFLKIKLTPEQLSSALGRMGDTECDECEISGLDKIGKKHENTNHKFEA